MAAVASCSSSSSSLHTPSAPASSTHGHPPQAAQSISAPQKPTFALARIKGDVCLVQVPDHSAHGALLAADVDVFRHEFITLFRYSHRATVHPADLAILERVRADGTLYEADRGTVFLARDVLARMQRLALDAAGRQHAHAHAHAPRRSGPMGAGRFARTMHVAPSRVRS